MFALARSRHKEKPVIESYICKRWLPGIFVGLYGAGRQQAEICLTDLDMLILGTGFKVVQLEQAAYGRQEH